VSMNVDTEFDASAQDLDGPGVIARGGPHTPGPVSCIVPKPRRRTFKEPNSIVSTTHSVDSSSETPRGLRSKKDPSHVIVPPADELSLP
jgi:hypothetical protein